MLTFFNPQTLKAFADLFGQLFALVSPLGAVTPFLELTARDEEMRKKVARRAAIAMAVLLIAAMLIGGLVLKFFGGIGCFRCAGGILIFMMGLDMARGRALVETPPDAKQVLAEAEGHKDASRQELMSLSVVPLAMPLLVGYRWER